MGRSKSRALSQVFNRLESVAFKPDEDKYVVFSDQHIGMKEFDRNKSLYLKALDYYYNRNFRLISIGDYEELHRYGIKEIKKKYRNDVYVAERRFLPDRYFRIFGNHDIDWKKKERVAKYLQDIMPELKVAEGMKLRWNGNFIFLAHGHQGDFINDTMGKLGRVILRWLARPLGISSGTSPAKNYRKRRKDETEYYNWAKGQKILFIAGHTHRPMFESLTKIDRIRMDIENKVREYISEKDPEKKDRLKAEIEVKKKEFEEAKEGEECLQPGEPQLLTPCYFNDGSCLHGSGITCMELYEEKIRLVFLYDKTRKENRKKHLRAPTSALFPQDPAATNYMRQILEEEKLEYVFARIKLLS